MFIWFQLFYFSFIRWRQINHNRYYNTLLCHSEVKDSRVTCRCYYIYYIFSLSNLFSFFSFVCLFVCCCSIYRNVCVLLFQTVGISAKCFKQPTNCHLEILLPLRPSKIFQTSPSFKRLSMFQVNLLSKHNQFLTNFMIK